MRYLTFALAKGKEVVSATPIQNLPYPHAPSKRENERHYARFMDIFKQLQVNIPFAEALEQMPKYATSSLRWKRIIINAIGI